MLITFKRKVPQRSDASQNDHKGYPSKTSAAAFTMQKSAWATWASDFLQDFLKSGSKALAYTKGVPKTTF